MHPYLILLARLLVGSVWLIASVGKLRERDQNSQWITDLIPLPRSLAQTINAVLPLLELTLGILLLIGLWLPYAAGASVVLLLFFAAVLAIRLLQGHRIECHEAPKSTV